MHKGEPDLQMELRFSPLFSGSSGNAIYVGCGETHLLVDAGLSGTRITQELKKIGVDAACLSAVIATHEHSDHTKGLGILSRKYDLPIYATAGTWRGVGDKIGAIDARNRCEILGGRDFFLGDINIMPFSTPHDAQEPIGLRFSVGAAVFVIATDIGCIKRGWMNYACGADAVLLESNYDPDMLKAGSYPYDLKRRILSNHGHLCNDDAAVCAVELAKSGVRHIILGHLSKENNFPDLARCCCENALRSAGIEPNEDVRLDIANRDGVTGIFGIRADYL